MQEIIMKELLDAGFHIRAVSSTRLPELKAEFECLHGNGMISDSMHATLCKRFCLDDITRIT